MPESTAGTGSGAASSSEGPYLPAVGTIVKDTHSDKIAEFRGSWAGVSWVRPVDGGREWPVEATNIREATPEEALSARNKARNHVIGARS
jgi:hypothetical protein